MNRTKLANIYTYILKIVYQSGIECMASNNVVENPDTTSVREIVI